MTVSYCAVRSTVPCTFTVYTVQCTLHSFHCTVFTEHTLYTVNFTLYSVYYLHINIALCSVDSEPFAPYNTIWFIYNLYIFNVQLFSLMMDFVRPKAFNFSTNFDRLQVKFNPKLRFLIDLYLIFLIRFNIFVYILYWTGVNKMI